MDVTAPTCTFCRGYRVENARHWLDPSVPRAAACPRCGRDDQPEHPGDAGRDYENREDFT